MKREGSLCHHSILPHFLLDNEIVLQGATRHRGKLIYPGSYTRAILVNQVQAVILG